MDTITSRGRTLRLVATLVGTSLLIVGSLWGSDDHFPFGPFSMYAGVNRLDDPAPDTRVEAVDAEGTALLLTERNTGVRRAEVEGQISRFAADPSLLRAMAEAYVTRNPTAARLVSVSVVVRWHELVGGEPTGSYRDEVAATWRA